MTTGRQIFLLQTGNFPLQKGEKATDNLYLHSSLTLLFFDVMFSEGSLGKFCKFGVKVPGKSYSKSSYQGYAFKAE